MLNEKTIYDEVMTLQKGDKVYLDHDVVECGTIYGKRGDAVIILKELPADERWDYAVYQEGNRNDEFYVFKKELTEVNPYEPQRTTEPRTQAPSPAEEAE